MKVAIIASEVVPFSKTGGLADVVGALPAALDRLGAQVLVISPLHRSAKKHPMEPCPELITVPLGKKTAWGAVRRSGNFYFLEHDVFFDRPGLYGDDHGDYGDNAARFVFLCRGALELLCIQGIAPDVIHVHDWQTALVPLYVKSLYAKAFPRTKTVLTIHNLAYQGRFWKVELPITGFGWDRFTARELEYYDDLNFLKGGLVQADALTTVSPTYAREIQTPEHGWGLEGVLRDRSAVLHGILNGVDGGEWSPEEDPHLAATYSAGALDGKAVCKAALQKRCGLPVRADAPIVAMVGRLVEQKGMDIFLQAFDELARKDVQIVVLGTGERRYQEAVLGLGARHHGRASVHIAFDNAFAHQIMAGSDILLVPSRYEPCGLTQIYALRYGTVPVVRSTGGLADTVEHGVTGFRFEAYSPPALLWSVGEALAAYRDRARWAKIMKEGMARDFSWDASAREYLRLFESLVTRP
jgi:starch synthase